MWSLLYFLAIVSYGMTSDFSDELRQESLLYGITTIMKEFNDTSTDACSKHLSILRHSIDNREKWALKMLDSSGTPGPGFLWGNNYWLGSYSQCQDILDRTPFVLASTINKNFTKYPYNWPPFGIEFYVASFRHNSTLQVHVNLPNENLITAGFCLPNDCTPHDIAQRLDVLFATRPLYMQKLYSVDFRLESVKSMHKNNSWLTEMKFIIVVLILLSASCLMFAGTVYDKVFWQPQVRAWKESAEDSVSNKNAGPVNIYITNNNIIAEVHPIKYPVNKPDETSYKHGVLGQLLVCFSVPTNTGILLDTQLGNDSVGAVHGLRFIGMSWIIMVHTIFYLSDYTNNKPYAFRLSEGFMVQIVSNSTLSVDTFFFLSGFLVSYLYYRGKQSKKEGEHITFRRQAAEFGLMVLRRYIRITPAYMVVIGILDINMSWYARSSLFHMTERADLTCSRYWWRNMLYINNLFSREEMCMSWSWYLSNDMQFFIIASFLLILSTRYWKTSITLLMILLISSSLLTGYISYINNYIPTLDKQFEMLSILYDPPWTRIGPYLVGIATGYIIVQLNGTLPLQKHTVAFFWILGTTCNLSALFGLYKRNISLLAAAMYVALSRTAWGIGLAWIIIACCTKNSGVIDSILSFRGWIPLSRLTYCAYLLNPMLINSVYLYNETSIHVDFLNLTAYFMGYLGISYVCAYVISLAFETPNILMMRIIINRNGDSKPT